ncbi:Conserved_hypothetical protein [Hexamita inflata]|uniref:Uncharacterized protein n=1 Tax=Hexamita inflata TaxID=28002 RepID=A0AA86VQ90_9EUKA|nr:Conserved hypothetical protein [Hexamita inflata]
MFALCSVLSECIKSPFPRTLYPEDSAYCQFFSQNGLNRWFKELMNNNTFNITNQKMPDIKTSINLGVTQVDVFFTDIVVKDFSVQDIKFFFRKSKTAPFNLIGVRFVLQLNWKIQQTSYPYLTDGGTGQIIVSDTECSTIFGAECDFEICPNHLLANIIHAELLIGSIRVVLEGGTSWLYQSMINLVLGVLQTELQKVISHFISTSLIDVLNTVFQQYTSFKHLESDYSIIKDERFVAPLMIEDGYAYFLFSGYTYHMDNTLDEYMTKDKLDPITYNRFNTPMQFIFSQAAFNNMYYIYHKYQNLYSHELFQVIDPPKLEIMNHAALLTLQLLVNSTNVEMKLKGSPRHYNDQNPAHSHKLMIAFDYVVYETQEVPSLNIAELEQLVEQHINLKMQNSVMVMINSELYYASDFMVLLDSVDKVVRLVHTKYE